ncbi:MAG: hypothetical protein ND807_13685 [Vicinamibacterales bacterium]|nr:hypothetical protein [Vicinamibacterales bacterium]
MKGYPRREFLLRALATCGTSLLVPIVPVGGARNQQSRTDAGRATQRAQTAADYFGGRTQAARAVGSAYLRQLGLDTSAASIQQATRATTTAIERASSQQKAIDALVAAVRRDFQEERSVQVEGWILSRTEAELCVLTLLPATN